MDDSFGSYYSQLNALLPLAQNTSSSYPLLLEMVCQSYARALSLFPLAVCASWWRNDLHGKPQVQGAQMVWLRAHLVYALYDFAATAIDAHGQPPSFRAVRAETAFGADPCLEQVDKHGCVIGQTRLANAKWALTQATAVVRLREAAYRVPLHRIAAWRRGPTAYSFTYLWAAHSLFFWW
jgi:hypothetical protein